VIEIFPCIKRRPWVAFRRFAPAIFFSFTTITTAYAVTHESAPSSHFDERLVGLEKRQRDFQEKAQAEFNELKPKIDLSASYVGLGHKQVDYWIGFLTIGLAVLSAFLAAATLFLPWLFTKKLREKYEDSIDGAREAAQLAREAAKQATEHARSAGLYAEEARQRSGSVLTDSLDNQMPATTDSALFALEQKTRDKRLSPEQRMRAQAVYFQSLENWSEAVKAAREFAELYPDAANSFNFLGFCLQNLAKTKSGALSIRILDEAISAYKKELDRLPNHAIALDNIGWTLIEKAQLLTEKTMQIDCLDSALQYLQRALILDPINITTLNNIAWSRILKSLLVEEKSDKNLLLQFAEDKLQIARVFDSNDKRTLLNIENIRKLRIAESE
jgi:tetratricopeptide (TPR) repeat protein